MGIFFYSALALFSTIATTGSYAVEQNDVAYGLYANTAVEPEEQNAVTYLCWDNSTPASHEDLLADPLLLLRASPRYTDHADSLPLAWQRAAEFDFLSIKDTPQQTSDYESGIQSRQKPVGDSKKSKQPPLIVNTLHTFDRTVPTFHLDTRAISCEKVWWQISSRPDFLEVISTFDSIQNFNGVISLTDLDDTFLESGQNYFFRAKTCSQGTWSPWSDTFSFKVTKPGTVENAHIEMTDKNQYELRWNGSEESYYVFGSNSLDFIPAIYSSVQADALLGTELIDGSAADNFLGKTTSTSWSIDGRYAYYRVIAQSHGRYSQPSPLIHFWESDNLLVGNILQLESTSDSIDVEWQTAIARRVALPPAYSWMQVRESDPDSGNRYKYVRNPYVSEEDWNKLQPYFLPENHPAKGVLDSVFRGQRVLKSLDAMKNAGFKPVRRPQNDLVVSRHAKIPGYIFKAYLDKIDVDERYWFQRRAAGARQVKECIDRHGYNSIMKVPQKWLYPLPPEPSPLKSRRVWRKDFILVVDDMQVLKYKKNRSAYKKRVTPEILDALYNVLMENLLVDSLYLSNITFCKDGKIAFLDTEFYNDTTHPMKMWKLAQYLSSDMHAYWDQLIQHGTAELPKSLTQPKDNDSQH